MALLNNSSGRVLVGILASVGMSCLYARGGAGWLLGFIFLVPWLCTLHAHRTLLGILLNAYLMSVAFTVAVFAWFAIAIGNYTQVGTFAGLLVLILAAPLFQPQFIAFALVRYAAGRRHGPVLGTLAAASGWVAAEWLIPKILGDTIGYGLYPAKLLRQAADVGGVPGLTFLLLLTNAGIAVAISRRSGGVRAMAKPLVIAALIPVLLAGYGLVTLSAMPTATGKPLRMGLVQSNMVNYERQRQEKGTYKVVRDVLDTHFSMTHSAVVKQRVDAMLWSETAYPTTFGHPKSNAGAEFDREILAIVNSAGVPFLFGTYDRDAAGEYNAAAFVEPKKGLLAFYRKTRLFPLTEHVPTWLDRPALRRWLPWLGTWQPGSGARVFPLRLADGREIPVLPLICLDDMDASLAIEGARLGAQVILTMSNDSWFTDHPGAALHHAAAAFRSIETRLPQFRVTTNGYSAVIDATGTVLAGARSGERVLVIGDLSVQVAPRTLMVAWGDWVGRASAAFLLLLAVAAALNGVRRNPVTHASGANLSTNLLCKVAVLSPVVRWGIGLLRAFARGSLLWLGATLYLTDAVGTNTLAQIRTFIVVFIVPEVTAWFVLLAFAAQVSIEKGALVLTRGSRRLELPLRDIASVEPWRLPVPTAGMSLRLVSGRRWAYGLGLRDPGALAKALTLEGGLPISLGPSSLATRYQDVRLAVSRGRLDLPFVKFLLFPLTLAVPAFRLHQNIAYGGSFGEYYMFGLRAYLTAFSIWWAAWVIGVVLSAAALRAAIETGALATALLRPKLAIDVRRWLEWLGLAALYLGLPAWLILRVL